MTDEEAIKNCKELIEELNTKYKKDKEFIGRLYYKNKPIEENLQILLNLIENQQKEIEYWKDKFDKELDDNIEKTTKIMKKDNRINELEKALEEKDKIIDKIEEEATNICIKARNDKEEIFKKDNIGNDSMNLHYSDRYMKSLGYEIAIRDMLKIIDQYFEKKEDE